MGFGLRGTLLVATVKVTLSDLNRRVAVLVVERRRRRKQLTDRILVLPEGHVLELVVFILQLGLVDLGHLFRPLRRIVKVKHDRAPCRVVELELLAFVLVLRCPERHLAVFPLSLV